MSAIELSNVGVVAIGRNEGERLERCLNSLRGLPLVYVDSGSSDNSVAFARSVGAQCVELDMTRPFTAARARNTGFRALLERYPDLTWVMFVDGDCEVQPNWLMQALEVAEKDPKIAAVCGRRRERFPSSSLYNEMCDIEWNTPVGDAKACGGDAMMRVSAFREVGGFDAAVIAGEEPELCVRLRRKGWKIRRIDAEMARTRSRPPAWLTTRSCGSHSRQAEAQEGPPKGGEGDPADAIAQEADGFEGTLLEWLKG